VRLCSSAASKAVVLGARATMGTSGAWTGRDVTDRQGTGEGSARSVIRGEQTTNAGEIADERVVSASLSTVLEVCRQCEAGWWD
jgi:hypothetical protein